MARSAYFTAGRRLQQFLPHSEKERILPGRGLDWKPKAVSRAARGRLGAPKAAVPRSLFVGRVDGDPLPNASAQSDWVSWTFLLRASQNTSH